MLTDRRTTIGMPSGTQTGAFNATITFSETVSGFVGSEVSLSGSAASITSWSANSDNTVYTATITPTANGTVTVGVAANVATDAANNQNTAATSQTVTVDVDKPSVTIGVPSGTQSSAFDTTITFSETVSGFVGSEVSLSGSAASITSWSANSDNTVYTATITPTASGIVTVSVAADVATDTANNQNTAATPQTVTIAMPELVQDLTTWMPDANLRNAVRKTLKLASDETFSQEDMQSLTHLSVQNRIKDLTGLEHATQLTELNVRYSNIGDISPLAGLTSLTILDLRGNNISDVTPLAKLVNLEKLWLSENPITDISPLAELTALRWLVIMSANVSDVTPLAKLVNLEQLLLAGNSITDFSPLSNLNNLQYADVEIPEPEPELLEVNISVPSDVQNGAFDATITFSEAVSDFVQADVSLGGSAASITSWSANSDNTVYTAVITPTASGAVTIGVAASVATDAANNSNTAATSQTVTVDVDKPTVIIGTPSGTQTGAFNATITFSETVSGFVGSEVSLSGSAASITSWSANNDNTVYTATITPTASGTITLGVAANVATDAANNPNTAATSQTVTVTVDTDAPGVTVSVPSGVQNGAFNVTITFTETVSGFTQSEVSLSGSAASITGWSANSANIVYTATITPTASGTVTVGVAANVATDAANNSNTAATSQTVTIDVDKPTVTIGVPSGTQSSAFDTTITFTETVSGFTQSEVSLSGSAASITSWSANSDNTVYTVTITPTASGTVTVGVAANVATDAANNTNTAATSQTVTVDVDRPTVTIGVPSDTQTDAFDVTITFSESVSGFVQSDLSLTGDASASVTAWSANTENTAYTATITPTTSGAVTLNVSAGVAKDAGNNANTAATSQTVRVDVDAPSVSIAMPRGNQTGAFDVTITFSESVSGFAQTDVFVAGTASASITAWNTADDTTFTATLTPSISGTVSLSVPANVATDAANNPNTASDTQTVTTFVTQPQQVDTTSPGVSITVPSVTQRSAFDVTITFTEAVSGFVQSELSLGGTANASVTAWSANSDDTVYTATITPTSSGTVILSITADVATDAANNPNTAGTSQTVNVDIDAPGVSITVPSDPQNSAFNVTITFTEAVSGFVQSELSLGGTANASVTVWSANSDDTVYTATITPTSSGTVILSITADVATDAANNPNTAGTSQTVNVDIDAPGVSITVPSDPQNSAFNVTITFSEAVSGFVQSELSLTSNTAGATITAWAASSDNTTYTATITPTRSGTVTLNVASDVATDAASNPNTAATSQTVNIDVDAPGVSITVPSDPQNSAFNVTITFSESVSDFVQSDVTFTGDASASITAWSANTENTTYTATITPTTSGEVTLGVSANVATDTANNPNAVATPQTVTVDLDAPTVTIGVPSGTQTSAFDATITFSETVSGFTETEISLTGSAASITSWSANSANTVYTATITPTASGTVTVSVAANVASDTAGNNNTATTSQSVTVNVPDAVPDPATWMPDANLRTAVRKALDLASDAVFTQDDMRSLTNLSTASSGISDITGLEHATLLTTLNVGENNISDISALAGLTTLTWLDLRNNSISNVTPLVKLVKLEKLWLSDNPISDISPLAGLTVLRWLVIMSAQVRDVRPLANLVNLEQLLLAGNPIWYISPLAGLTALHSLDLRSANVRDVTPLANLVNLRRLYITGNPVTDFSPLSSLNSLKADVEIPGVGVSITVPQGVQNGGYWWDQNYYQNGPFEVTITFTEEVSGFEQSDVVLNCQCLDDSPPSASITEWNTTDNIIYTATMTPTASGDVGIKVPEGVATDTAGNPNTSGYIITGIRLTAEVPDEDLHELLGLALEGRGRPGYIRLDDMLRLIDVSVRPVYSAAGRVIPYDMNISDLTGLEYATNLETLDLIDYSDVSDLTPLTSLTNLEILKLDAPDVSDLTPLSGLTNLETLKLVGYSDVSDFTALSGLTNLETLDLDSSVSDLTPLSGLTNPEDLKAL